jgi:CubicO group peptidase (beta-lactamase class C family)
VIEDVASVQKSVVSVLLGIAQEKGLLRISDPVSKYLGNGWSKAPPDKESRITLRHLITMSSGLTEKLEYEAPPGTKWRYNTRAYALTREAIAAAAKMDSDRLTKQWLTERIGMADSGWRPRPRVGGREIANLLGFATTARDLARFGLLMLADGVWKGNVILRDREYLRESLSPSQQMNPSYGFLWWLNGHPRATPGGGKSARWLIPDAPKDLVAAQGALGRKLYIVPGLGLVVTRLGDAPEIKGQEDFNNGFWKRIMAAAR